MTEKSKPEQLTEPFDASQLRSLSKGGTTLSYIPIAEVNDRLNRVLGVGQWGVRINRLWEAGDNAGFPTWIMAHVRVVYVLDGREASETEGVGGQKVKFERGGGGPVDLGDEYKGAVSDAVKKAVQGPLGVGLDIARKDDALAWAAEANRVKADPTEIIRLTAGFDTIVDAEHRKAVKKAFVSRFGPPVDLLEEQLPDAVAYVEAATGMDLHPKAAPAPAPEAPETAPVAAVADGTGEAAPATTETAGADTEAEAVADEARQVGAPKEAAEVDPDAPPAPGAALDAIKAHVEALPEDEQAVFRGWWTGEVGKSFTGGKVTIPEVEKAFEYLGLDPTA